jgi:hypothetical protein
VPRSREYNLGTELILLSARALDDFFFMQHVCNQKFKMSDWSAFGHQIGKYRMRRFQPYLQKGKRTSGRRSNHVSRQQMCQNGHNADMQAHGNLGGKCEMGQESE